MLKCHMTTQQLYVLLYIPQAVAHHKNPHYYHISVNIFIMFHNQVQNKTNCRGSEKKMCNLKSVADGEIPVCTLGCSINMLPAQLAAPVLLCRQFKV
jgi:hypothetical protein